MRSLFTLSVVVFFNVSLSAQPVALLAQEQPGSISVSGSAEVLVAPDEVHLRFAVESRDPQLELAVQDNEARTAAVLKFLQGVGIAAKDVQTDYLQIHPVHSPRHDVQQIHPEYYQATRGFGVRLRKVSQFDAVLAGVIKAGANHMDEIECRSTKLRKHRDLARQNAIRAAREKATALAQELDAKIGKARSIREQSGHNYQGWSRGHRSVPQFQNISQNVAQIGGDSEQSSEQNLSVGMISISASVDVTFSLE